MPREPALEGGECPLARHRPQVRRVTHTHPQPHQSSRLHQAKPQTALKCQVLQDQVFGLLCSDVRGRR
eukprot:7099774-Prymnesium_polylepis.1